MKYSILIILTSLLAASDIKIACEEHLFHQYPENTDIRMHILKLDKQMKKEVENQVKQKFYRDKLYYWTISQDDTTIAYAFLDNVIGKSMPITFWVILTQEGFIEHTEIIKYREPYGGEIQNENWTEIANGVEVRVLDEKDSILAKYFVNDGKWLKEFDNIRIT